MARINIEDSIYQDIRFIDLTLKSGSVEMALGIMVRAWTVAQGYWKQGKRPIPRLAYAKLRLSPLIVACGLATETEDGDIYICGSEKQFAWLVQKQEAGKLGGLKSLRKKVSVAKRTLSGDKPLTLTLTPSLTPTLEQEHIREPDAVASGPTTHELMEIWNENCDTLPKSKGMNSKRMKAAQARWRERPDREYWIKIVKLISQSPFCKGGGKNSWRATFDWFLKPDTHLKTLEGQYGSAETTEDIWSKMKW